MNDNALRATRLVCLTIFLVACLMYVQDYIAWCPK
jgi:hypothetical protein